MARFLAWFHGPNLSPLEGGTVLTGSQDGPSTMSPEGTIWAPRRPSGSESTRTHASVEASKVRAVMRCQSLQLLMSQVQNTQQENSWPPPLLDPSLFGMRLVTQE